jgi:hypothetical protein
VTLGQAATLLAVVGLVAWGCGNKCDELADELSACPAAGQGGSAGGDTGDECTEVEDKCAGCLLDSGKALCDKKAFGEAATACAADCPP